MMTAPELSAWREAMKFSKGQAEDALGLAPHTYRRYERGLAEIPRYVALACAAIANGIPAIGDDPPSITEAKGFDGRAQRQGDKDGFADPPEKPYFDPDAARDAMQDRQMRIDAGEIDP